MKSIIFLFIAIFTCISVTAQLKMNTTGDFGIGTDPQSNYYKLKVYGPVKITDNNTYAVAPLEIVSGPNSFFGCHISGAGTLSGYKLYVAGAAYATGMWRTSDVLYKKNITDLDGNLILPKLMNISGKKYEFKNKDEVQQVYSQLKNNGNREISIPEFPEGQQYGLIAQELEKEFPELVHTDSITQTKAINYSGMIPILLEAIKSLNTEIEDLKSQVPGKSPKSGSIISETGSRDLFENDNNKVNLEQNVPNPFAQQTTIKMFIPKETESAIITISDLQGIQLQSKAISDRGNVNLILEATNLMPGIYVYTLLADGKNIDTKKMILTE
ncbi:MAG: tail fiber domain-containing protein [bacterium]